MTSSPIPEEDHAFRYLLKNVMEHLPTLYLQFDKEFPAVAAVDLRIVSIALQENFVRALFFEYHVGRQWAEMWKDYYPDMASSASDYVKVVLYSCLEMYDAEEPFYERFLDIFGMVAAASLTFSIECDYHVYAAPILIAFFESHLRDPFYDAGGWSGLEQYLEGLPYLDWYFARGNMKYIDVRKRLNKEVAWKRRAKSYHRDIRFVSTADAFHDPTCKRLAEKVLTMDTTVCDRPDEGTAESLLARENLSKVRRWSLLSWSKPLSLKLEQRECVERDVASEIAHEVAKLTEQGKFEVTMLRAAAGLIQGIKDELKEAEKVSDTLKQLYSFTSTRI